MSFHLFMTDTGQGSSNGFHRAVVEGDETQLRSQNCLAMQDATPDYRSDCRRFTEVSRGCMNLCSNLKDHTPSCPAECHSWYWGNSIWARYLEPTVTWPILFDGPGQGNTKNWFENAILMRTRWPSQTNMPIARWKLLLSIITQR